MRGDKALAEIQRDSGSEKIFLMFADLAVQTELLKLAKLFKEQRNRLDLVVNDAGLIRSKRIETPDGIELTLAVNHLARSC
jgi:retinol dehydrogenase 14